MKAAVCTQYGSPDVITIQTLCTPVPSDNDMLIKVIATTVNSADSRIRSLNVPQGFGLLMRLIMGFAKPRNAILGTELAGVVQAVGKNITAFKVGDYVIADCGMKMGAHAQFRLFKESDVITHAPKNIDITEAGAMIFGAATALYFLKNRAALRPNEKVLINGAAGSVGTAAIQIAHHLGAQVTAVCSGKRAAMVSALGASHVIDYTKTPVLASTQQYDVIMDNIGNLAWQDAKTALHSGGRFLQVVASLYHLLSAPLLNILHSMLNNKRYIVGTALVDKPLLTQLKQLVEIGAFKPVISQHIALDNIKDAYKIVDSGHKTGSVLILCHDV